MLQRSFIISEVLGPKPKLHEGGNLLSNLDYGVSEKNPIETCTKVSFSDLMKNIAIDVKIFILDCYL